MNDSCQLGQAIIQDKREEKLSFLPLSSTNVDSSVTEEVDFIKSGEQVPPIIVKKLPEQIIEEVSNRIGAK